MRSGAGISSQPDYLKLGVGNRKSMKTLAILTMAGIGALLVAVLSFTFGAAFLGTTAVIAALMCTAASLAWLGEHSRFVADLHRRTYDPRSAAPRW